MNTGQFRAHKRTQKDHTLAFKLQVVDDVEKGDFTYKEAQKHGIQGRSAVLIWLRKGYTYTSIHKHSFFRTETILKVNRTCAIPGSLPVIAS